jgi:hypothetical protein
MHFGAKSANQDQDNSKGPCEDAGGNRYKSIYIHSKTSPISTLKVRSARKMPLLQNRHTKKPDYGLQLHIVRFGGMTSGLKKQK